MLEFLLAVIAITLMVIHRRLCIISDDIKQTSRQNSFNEGVILGRIEKLRQESKDRWKTSLN